MNDRLTGVILKKYDYREYDELIKVLTKDYGLLTFVSRGSKKISGKNRNALNYYLEIELSCDLSFSSELHNFKSAVIINNYLKTADLETMVIRDLANEIVYSLVLNNENSDKYYDLLIGFYQNVSEYKYLSICILIAGILALEGLSPEIDHCVYCDSKKVVGVSFLDGGFCCEKHLHKADIYDVLTLKKFRIVNRVDFSKIKLVDHEYNFEDLKILLTLLNNTFNYEYRAFKLLADIKNL